jgi:mRNA interferase MazF
MGQFVRGDVVVVPFPFSDLSRCKRRPAFVVVPLVGDDVILCQITSRLRSDGYSVSLSGADFESGGIGHDSNVRPNRLFTADSRIIRYRAGRVSAKKAEEVISKIIEIVSK